MGLNDSQQKIADTIDGLIVVDAGPGTGKTHTIVERYLNIISRPDVSPNDVLLLTFTNNAAAEMDERIKNRMTSMGMKNESKLVQTKTFDAFCLSVVLDSPDLVSDFFGFDEKLTRAATLQQNDALNRDYFQRFLDDFLSRKGSDYQDISVIATEHGESIRKLIYKLMSRGLIPLKKGWFGKDYERDLDGDLDKLLENMSRLNVLDDNKCKAVDILQKLDEERVCGLPPLLPGAVLSEEVLNSAVKGNRGELFRFVHDVYYEYIKRSISDNRLTFGLNAMFAFTVLFNNSSVRKRNSYRYLMVDEFQDTNSNQMMISLMILEEPNLCVVGDWKQGIYGFRFVSIDNITNFESKCIEMRRFLNDDVKRIDYQIPEVIRLSLDVNYRSSQAIIDKAYECIALPGPSSEKPKGADLDKITLITQGREDIGDDTEIRFAQSKSKEEEVADVVNAIKDYVLTDKYVLHDGDKTRRPEYGDIAIICRKTEHCRAIMEACIKAGIQAYLQGDVQIMSTREGKLALAWLRFVNNEADPWGYVPIMADMNYTPVEIKRAARDFHYIPESLLEQRQALYSKRRRITELLTTLFSYYGMDNDITQAIISTVSSLHRGSLLTISDVIGIIESDIEMGSTYPVENFIDSKAVTIMTMHKSKGLQFPIVICPFIDSGIMPSTKGDSDVFSFDETAGIRCSLEIGRFKDYSKICIDWRTKLVNASIDADYSEERRLMFVALSRAEQYETIICGPKPSTFMKGLSREEYVHIPKMDDVSIAPEDKPIAIPDIPWYPPRRMKIGIHEILDFSNGEGESNPEGTDEVCGKGMEYGTEIHKLAQTMCLGGHVDETRYPELPEVRKVLDRLSDADLLFAEIECGLPIDGLKVTLRGIIDLLALYPDHIEVHDYKTDVSDRFESEYIMQLSIYAHAARLFYNKDVECYIDYVSRGVTKRIDILPIERIHARVEDYLNSLGTSEM